MRERSMGPETGRLRPERPADCSRNPNPEASNAPASRTVERWELARAP